ncbi:MAG: RecX family transcriptional regulator [Bacilli bacterium]|nr:RecX family transcriptional regulator [Bacilli bacterium]
MSEQRIGEPITVLAVKVKGREVRVSFSNGEKIVFSVDSFTDFHLYAGKEVSDEEMARIQHLSDQDQAYDYAIRRLSQDSYSVAEMRRKMLAKGFDPKIVTGVIDRLTGMDLLDDKRFALTYAEDVGDLRCLGYHRIVYDLRVKGIGEDLIATLSFPLENEKKKAERQAAVLDRRYYRTPYARRILKINRALLERGFDESVAHEASNKVAKAPDPELERSELEKAFALANAKYTKKYTGYELSRHIYAFLVRKGFDYDEVKSIMEEHGL